MKICVDENIPLVTVVELRKLGHDVLDVRGTIDQGISDDLLWAKIQREKRLLITTDKGFVNNRREAILESSLSDCISRMKVRFTKGQWEQFASLPKTSGPACLL